MKQMIIQNTWSLRSASHTFREAFTAEQRARLFAAQREYILPKDEIIYRQDDTPHFLYYVLEGTVRLYREGRAERAQTLPGVERCTVWVTGSPNKLWLQADASVSKDCEVEWAVAQLRRQLNDDIVTSLGTAPKQIDLLVRLARSTSAKSVSKTVTGQRY